MKVTPTESALAQDYLRHERELAQALHDKPLIWLSGFGVGLAIGGAVTFGLCYWLLG